MGDETSAASGYLAPATKRDVLRLNLLMQTALLDVVGYMVADWGQPDEAKKKEAIDALLGKMREINAFTSALGGESE